MSQRHRAPRSRRVLRIAITVFLAGAWAGVRAQQPAVFGPLLCKPLPYGGGSMYWLSLPAQGPIRSGRELYDLLGGASNVMYVRKMFPQSSQRTYDGTCTNGEPSPPCATSTYPAPCFCINPGEGVEVRLSSTPGVLRILGADSDPTILLTAGATSEVYLISLPYAAAIATASDLLADIGTAIVSEVRKRVPATGAIQVYRTSGPGTVNFSVVPGEGYEVVVRPGVTYYYIPSVYPPVTFPTCSDLCADYSLAGTGSGSLFTWQVLEGSSSGLCGIQWNSFTAGDDAATMAVKFRDFIATEPTCQAANVTAISPAGIGLPVFRVCIGSSGPPGLLVASPPCLVSAAGCTFNPTIQTTVLPPADPGRLTMRKNGTIAILDWNDIGDPGLSWNVYRNGGLWAAGIHDADTGTPGIQWNDPDVPAARTMFAYIVTAVNPAGESPH